MARIHRGAGCWSLLAAALVVSILLCTVAGAKAGMNNSTDGLNESKTPLSDALKNASGSVSLTENVSTVNVAQKVLLENWNWLCVLLLILAPATVVFYIILRMGYRADRSLSKGEMRRAMAGAFVVGIHALLAVSIIFDIARNIVVGAYLGAISSIMGFYFGSRTAQQQQAQQAGLEIENVEFRDDKKVVVSVRNRGFMDVVVDAVYIGNKHFDLRQEIPSGSVRHIEFDFDWEAGSYEIKICTSEGLKAEGKFDAPEKEKESGEKKEVGEKEIRKEKKKEGKGEEK
ncbi:hypothetical protein [Archaeoglobus veneficus]|uniref:Uncharacterized protein n=1 Tax=Archaeoglobus veneficus (strain DSM 11195 / SNP6) TaxID=693661 RepID=F2KNG2_ARCVS|nr:hypothetical protein [Archaeoglobus veneficus]AEA47364.1 hypothetical protein Arcve_1360 [Archaeoglobus veneficus SNP6]